MKKHASTLAVFLLIALAGKASFAQKSWSTSAQKEIADVEMRWLQHIDDPRVLQTILADDFVHVLASGMITKEQHIDYVKAHPRSRNETRSFENLTLRVYGDTGIANGVVDTTNSSGTHRTVFTDVFVKRDGQWKAVNAQENAAQEQH